MIYGYRTQLSMASQEAWDEAHRMGGRIWSILGIIMVAVTVIVKLLFPSDPEPAAITFSLLGGSFIAIFMPIGMIQHRLKETASRKQNG